MRLVLACGHAGCLKTTITLAVAPRLALNIVATYGMGAFDGSSAATLARDRAVRYAKLIRIVRACLQQGLSVWVDGNFPTGEGRRALWDAARTSGVTEVVVLQCICSEPSLLEERFARRRTDPTLPDAAANDVGAYTGSVQQFEAIDAEELHGFAASEVLVYDSCLSAMMPSAARTRLGADVQHALTAAGFIRPPGPPRARSNTG